MASASVLTMPWIPQPTDGLTTETLTLQADAESAISSLLSPLQSPSAPTPLLQKAQHTSFLTRFLRQPLPRMFTGLDASRPWILYWSVHSLALFNADLDTGSKGRMVETLKRCQNEDGGFGGGPGQLSHLAPSYAAVCALCYAGEEGWRSIDRPGLYRFLLSLKQPDGSFIMHDGGEVDVRGAYCALTIAILLNLLTPDLARSTSSFIASCQTYEGGLASSAHPFAFPSGEEGQGAAPLGEAHGGYTFCAAASYSMLLPFSSPSSPAFSPSTIPSKHLDVRALLRWSASMQAMPIEGGGFRGRTNKLVDGCYSWWCGGLFPVIDGLLEEENEEEEEEEEETVEEDLFDRNGLQQYITLVAQQPSGGLRDKPGKPADAYHTCYNLAGAASAQSRMKLSRSARRRLAEGFESPFAERTGIEEEGQERPVVIKGEEESEEEAEKRMREVWSRTLAWEVSGEQMIYGDKEENELMPNHPLFNLCSAQVESMMAFFYLQPEQQQE